MKQLAFCEYCMNDSEYKVNKKKKLCTLKDLEINYIAKESICSNCGNEIFVSDICDYNLNNLYKEYRRKKNIISIDEILDILFQYSIDEKALSLLLGWDIETISRYIEGDMLGNCNSENLKKIYENHNYYSIILQTNKERVSPVDYNKSRKSIGRILSKSITEEKVDSVIKYFLIRCEDLTPFALQKLLYYTQSYYYVFTNNFIFAEDPEAWKDGPCYRSVHERYEQLGYEEVNNRILSNYKLKLGDFERNVLESIIKFYGCYSGKILKQMSQNEAPWILTRTNSIKGNDFEDDNYSEKIEKSLIAEYFVGIKEKYNIRNLLDIQKYSLNLFNQISM